MIRTGNNIKFDKKNKIIVKKINNNYGHNNFLLENRFSMSKKNLTICIRFENCICQFDKAVIQYYEKNYNPKKKKPFETLKASNIKENYSQKERETLNEIINSEKFWEEVEIFPDVILALDYMRQAQYDVKIFLADINYTCIGSVGHRYKWIEKHLKTHYYMERIMVCNDRTILDCDFLVDPEPLPEKTGQQKIKWKHMVFEAPYNQDVKDKSRIKDWGNWKLQIEGSQHKERPFYIHGSTDSKDIDKYYLFDDLPSAIDCFNFCNGSKDEDRNPIVIKGDVILKTHKGKRDECNNSLFQTYGLHKQIYPCPVKRNIVRIVPLKFLQFIRKSIGLFSHEKLYETDIKVILKKDVSTKRRLDLFKTLDVEKCENFDEDKYKILAFQYILLLGLMKGVEVYTKQDAVKMYPKMKPFLYREKSKDCYLFNELKNEFFDLLEGISFEQENEYVTLRCKLDKDSKINLMKYQSNGIILNTQIEEVIYYPFDQGFEMKSTWMNEKQEYFYPKINEIYDTVTIYKKDKNQYLYFGNPKKCEVLKKFKSDLLDFDKYYYIFDVIDDELYLIGLRSKLYYDLESPEVVKFVAKELGIKHKE